MVPQSACSLLLLQKIVNFWACASGTYERRQEFHGGSTSSGRQLHAASASEQRGRQLHAASASERRPELRSHSSAVAAIHPGSPPPTGERPGRRHCRLSRGGSRPRQPRTEAQLPGPRPLGQGHDLDCPRLSLPQRACREMSDLEHRGRSTGSGYFTNQEAIPWSPQSEPRPWATTNLALQPQSRPSPRPYVSHNLGDQDYDAGCQRSRRSTGMAGSRIVATNGETSQPPPQPPQPRRQSPPATMDRS